MNPDKPDTYAAPRAVPKPPTLEQIDAQVRAGIKAEEDNIEQMQHEVKRRHANIKIARGVIAELKRRLPRAKKATAE